MDAVLLAALGCVELEKPEFNRSLCEGGVEVKHVVAAVVVVLCPAVIRTVSLVPDVGELCHRVGLFAVQLLEEGRVDRAAIVVHAAAVQPKGCGEELFVACHDVGEVAEGLRRVAVGSDVDVNVM